MSARIRVGGYASWAALAIGLAAVTATTAQPTEPSRDEFDAAYSEYVAANQAGDIGAIAAAAKDALEKGSAVFGESDREMADLHRNYAAILETLGFVDSARDSYSRAVDIYREHDGEDSTEQIPLLVRLAAIGKVDTADDVAAISENISRSLELQRTDRPDDLVGYAALATECARILLSTGGRRDARRILDPLLTEVEQTYGENSIELVPVLMALGRARAATADPRVQRRYIDRALEIAEDAYREDPVALARLELEAGTDLLEFSRSRTGERYIEGAVKSLERTAGPEHEATANAELTLGEMYSANRKYGRAAEALEVAAGFYSGKPAYRLELLRTLAVLIDAYENERDNESAAAHEQAFARLSIVADNQEYLPLFTASPAYPVEDIISGTFGAFDLQYEIDASGRPQNATVVDSSGSPAMAEAALESVARYRYLPRVVDGEPVIVKKATMMIFFSPSN